MRKVSTEVIRREIRVTGDVQGVGFRYRAKHAASGLGLTGWVKNDWDGSVVMEVQGTEEMIFQMLKLINQSSYIRIDCMESKDLELCEGEYGFHIR